VLQKTFLKKQNELLFSHIAKKYYAGYVPKGSKFCNNLYDYFLAFGAHLTPKLFNQVLIFLSKKTANITRTLSKIRVKHRKRTQQLLVSY
jgi:hypothetical protein